MPPIKKHVQLSMDRTGKSYREVHEWIDDPEKKNERHDFSKVLVHAKMFEEKYGAEAAQEYVEHLVADLKGKFGHVVEDSEALVADALKYFGAR
ncbi:MAG: hypothetical protein DSY90_02345 [Deltaproteobacteria bacterium]|nr:MAG: hypothetical protein DSY90_02345 [Deltaproteobacteria bacterium]RTZ99985.1 MAG: hypothetical protein DSY89_07495 [Deltaproteobacteria bacterium]